MYQQPPLGGRQPSESLKLTQDPGEAKVTQLDDLVFGDEDVLRLDVSVDALHARTDRTERTERRGKENKQFH